jgi:hypothetical protein
MVQVLKHTPATDTEVRTFRRNPRGSRRGDGIYQAFVETPAALAVRKTHRLARQCAGQAHWPFLNRRESAAVVAEPFHLRVERSDR